MAEINFHTAILSNKEYVTNDILLIVMKKTFLYIASVCLIVLLSGCVNSKAGQANTSQNGIVAAPTAGIMIGGGTKSAIPRAVIYQTSCDCDNLVPVNLNLEGTSLLSFPAPTDLSASSTPVNLEKGWLLDRRGIGVNTRFTNYTYEEYRNLSQAPTPSQLLDNINDDCHITKIVKLPISLSEAVSNPQLCNNYIASGLENCEIVYAESK